MSKPLAILALLLIAGALLLAQTCVGRAPAATPRSSQLHAAEERAPLAAPLSAADAEPTTAPLRALPTADASRISAAGTEAAPIPDTAAWTGTVVGQEGEPIPGATVFAALQLGPQGLELAELEALAADPSVLRLTISDESGRFHLPAPDAEGRAFLGARTGDLLSDGSLAPRRPGPTQLQLAATNTLFGTVHDSAGEPVAGARVEVALRDGLFVHRPWTVSDPSGAYSVGPLPTPKYQRAIELVVEHPLHPRLVEPIDLLGAQQLATGRSLPAGLWPWEVYLPAAASITVQVRDAATGAPVAGAEVLLASAAVSTHGAHLHGVDLAPLLYGREAWATGHADARGIFVAERLPAGSPVLRREPGLHPWYGYAVARAPGYGLGFAELSRPASGARVELTLELGRAATVRGRVLDPEGGPLAGAVIRVERADSRLAITVPGWRTGHGRGTTEADGSFLLTDVTALGPAEVQRVTISGPRVDGSPRWRGQTFARTLEPGADCDLGDVLLQPLGPGYRLRLRVVDPAGLAAADTHVEVVGSHLSATTDGTGTAEMHPLSGGSLEVLARHPQLGSGRAVVDVELESAEPSGPPTQLSLEPYARVFGRVVDGAGQPLPAARVEIEPSTTRPPDGSTAARAQPNYRGWRQARAAADGSFECLTPEQGPYRVTATLPAAAAGAHTPRASAQVAAGEACLLVLEVPPVIEPAQLCVTVGVEPRATAARVEPLDEERSGSSIELLQTAPRRFESPALTPGTWRLTVTLAGQARQVEDLELGPGERRELLLAAPPRGTIRGRLFQARRGDSLEVLGANGVRGTSALDAQGQFEVNGLRAGDYRLVLLPAPELEPLVLVSPPVITLSDDRAQVDVELEAQPAALWWATIAGTLTGRSRFDWRLEVHRGEELSFALDLNDVSWGSDHLLVVPLGPSTLSLLQGGRVLRTAEIVARRGDVGRTYLEVPPVADTGR
jgi:protocatechuate 3,4-dioxygenase beta subunit